MASGNPTSNASDARRARSSRRRTIATESAASGPNSGPTTMAPTTVTVESVTTPTAASRHANVRNSQERHAQRRLLRGSARSVRPRPPRRRGRLRPRLRPCAPARQHGVEDFQRDRAARCTSSAFSCLMTSLAHSRAMSAVISSPTGSSAAPGCTTMFATPTSRRSTSRIVVAHLLGRDHPQMQHGAP